MTRSRSWNKQLKDLQLGQRKSSASDLFQNSRSNKFNQTPTPGHRDNNRHALVSNKNTSNKPKKIISRDSISRKNLRNNINGSHSQLNKEASLKNASSFHQYYTVSGIKSEESEYLFVWILQFLGPSKHRNHMLPPKAQKAGSLKSKHKSQANINL